MAIYTRVFTGEQNSELHFRELWDYASRGGFTVHREYVDQASGPTTRPTLPACKEIYAAMQQRRISIMQFMDSSRTVRSD